MVENLDTARRDRRRLQATALLMGAALLLLGSQVRPGPGRPERWRSGRGRSERWHPGHGRSDQVASAAGTPTPAPAAFLAAPSRAHVADGAAAPDESERIAALAEVLSGGERRGGGNSSAGGPAARPDAAKRAASPQPAAGGVAGSTPPGRAEVVARLERGGREYWVLSVEPEGRLLRAVFSPGEAGGGAALPPPEPYLREADGRFELVSSGRRYRVVEPPWEGSHTAVVGESP